MNQSSRLTALRCARLGFQHTEQHRKKGKANPAQQIRRNYKKHNLKTISKIKTSVNLKFVFFLRFILFFSEKKTLADRNKNVRFSYFLRQTNFAAFSSYTMLHICDKGKARESKKTRASSEKKKRKREKNKRMKRNN